MKSRNKTTHVLLAALVLGLTISPFAVAKAGDLLKIGKSNSSSKQTTLKANTSGTSHTSYGIRSTNSGSGGAGIFSSRGTGSTLRSTNKNSSANGLGLSVSSKKGPAAEFKTSDTTAAPITVSNNNVVTNLHAENSDQLGGQSSGRYAAAGVRVQSTGVISTSFTAYGLDTTQGTSGVSRTSAGVYTVFLPNPSGQYLIQVTPAGVAGLCTVASVSTTTGSTGVNCFNVAGVATDTEFYFSATKP